MAIIKLPQVTSFEELGLLRTEKYPRIRYMGSKYRVIPYLMSILINERFETVFDAFSGSGVVSYAFKEIGKQVTSNDFLSFSATIARSLVENKNVLVNNEDKKILLSPNKDNRNFISSTFRGLYFSQEDHEFLDAIWSHIEGMPIHKKDLVISALCLSAARKQPRGVFTISDMRYDDGRRTMHMPLKDLFLEAIEEYNQSVFDNGRENKVFCNDVFSHNNLDYDLVYFDPPYAPPKDDADYIKRYHFLEGLSVYWEGLEIMENTKSKKIPKRFTPFAYKKTVSEALLRLFKKFENSKIVLSYSSNSVPSAKELLNLLRQVKKDVTVYSIPHTYSFGTHSSATRRSVEEYIFIAR